MLLSNSWCNNENISYGAEEVLELNSVKKGVRGRNKDERMFKYDTQDVPEEVIIEWILIQLFSLSEWLFLKSFISGRISDIMSDWHRRYRKNNRMNKSNLKIPFNQNKIGINRTSSPRWGFTLMLKIAGGEPIKLQSTVSQSEAKNSYGRKKSFVCQTCTYKMPQSCQGLK